MTFDCVAIPGFQNPFSSISHLAAAGVFLVLGFFLFRKSRGHPGIAVATSVFAFSTIFLLAMSGVYHLLSLDGLAREVLRRLDHAAIFVLIAGTFTAVHALRFVGVMRWGMIAAVWVFAVAGIVLKSVFFHSIPEILGVFLYLSFGWLGVVTVYALWRQGSFDSIRPLVFGGIAYTFGALLDAVKFPVLIEGVVGPHEIFHIAVVIGIGFHWYYISRSLSEKMLTLAD